PRLPAGGHRRRLGMHGGARRRALPRLARGASRHRPHRRARVGRRRQPTRRLRCPVVDGERPRWVDLVDPSESELGEHLPPIHPTALAALLAPHVHDDEPRPRIESHGEYVLGIMLLPVAVRDEDRVFYQEIDWVATPAELVSISKTPPGVHPLDPKPAQKACREHEEVGMFVYHLVDEIAESFLDLIDDLDDE